MKDVVFLQPALPTYRFDFFQRIFAKYGNRFRVYYSEDKMNPLELNSDSPVWALSIGRQRSLFMGLTWQPGVLSLDIAKGDILVVCGAVRSLSTLLLLIRCRYKGVKTIWWSHYWSASSSKVGLLIRMLIAKTAHSLLFYTDAEVAQFSRDGWSHSGKVASLNNGIYVDEIECLRKPYKHEERSKTLIFIGRLTKKARLDLLIHAMARPELKEFNLEIIGDGDEGVTLQKIANESAVGERIRWHGESANEEFISNIANKGSIFVYPGGVGLSLIHAMSYGLPAVLHDNEKHHMPEFEAFKDGETGSVFIEGQVSSLAEVIRSISDSPIQLDKMSRRCLEVIEGKYSTKHMASRFFQLTSDLEKDEVC